jgi:UDPglucose 6-dehydrogenase
MMKIAVIGAKGVVGSAVANYFNSLGHDVIRHDVKKGPGITTDLRDAIVDMDFTFMCVPTPSGVNGKCDTSIVEKVTIDIGRIASFENCPVNLVYKSTMPPGSTTKLEIMLQRYCRDLAIAYNPEFLRQKYALEDMMNPSRIVVGSKYQGFGFDVMKLYDETDCFKELFQDYESAELVKYYANAYYASRISFFNQMKFFADAFQCDHDRIVKAIVADKSVGVHGSNPTGKSYGGACLPKDVKAIIACGKLNDINVNLLESIEAINNMMIDNESHEKPSRRKK